MDAIHYDKIADKLIQFRSKIRPSNELSSTLARIHSDKLKKLVDDLLLQIDYVAVLDDKGLIK